MSYVSQNPVRDTINRISTAAFSFAYKNVVKPHIFNQSPDAAHDEMIRFCQVSRRIPPLMWTLRQMLDYTDPLLETTVMGVDFANPFGLSAGLDKNCDLPVVLDNAGFGFETVGSTTSRPCEGNPRPWFHRLPEYASMMIHVGLANDGSEAVVERAAREARRARAMKLSVSLARTNDDLCGDIDEGIEDYKISLLRAADRTHMVEINISCPNTRKGEPFTQAGNLDRLFTELDKVDHSQPLLVKMPQSLPWPRFKELLDVLVEHKVDGVTIANLRKDRTGLEVPPEWEGSLSGLPCVGPSNKLIARTYRDYGDRMAIAGVGGVFTPQQAYDKIKAGSSLIMFISSLMYRGPQNITTLKRGLADLLRADGYQSVSQAVGADIR